MTITINTVTNDNINIDSVKDWYTNTTIGSTGLKLASIGPRPGTSAFAANLGLNYDEVHVGVIERSTKTVVERIQYLSKYTDGVSAEGASAYYPTIVKEASNYVYFGSHNTAAHNPTTGGAGVAAGTLSLIHI